MRFAVKVLRRSDLTFFEPQIRIQNAGKQKSITLNRRSFVDELYPELPEILAEAGGELEVRLRINGPGAGHNEIRIVRKITKGETYKNYRLNGEVVRNPEDAATRFDDLAPGDLALMGFEGAGRPRTICMFVIAASNPDDAALHAALAPPPGRSMIAVDHDALARAIAAAPPEHPVHDLFLEPALADDLARAAEGDAEATRRLLSRPGQRRVTSEQLAQARRTAERLGLAGEQLIAGHLGLRSEAGDLVSWVWRSAENAISPCDFELTESDGAIQVEVKTTSGDHDTPFHISMAELETAAQVGRYDLYRVSQLDDDGGTLQIAEDVASFARKVLMTVTELPPGIRPDGFTVSPKLLIWGAPTRLKWLEAEE